MGVKAVIKIAHMPEEMQQDAVALATKAIEKYHVDRIRGLVPIKQLQGIAVFIRKGFEEKHNSGWQCVVGKRFGSYVTHEPNHFLYFYVGEVAILLFKAE